MQSAITRLALFQFLVVVYSVLFVCLIEKIRFGSHIPQIFATHLRDYGFLLLLLPAAWLVVACVCGNRPRAGVGDLGPILLSGLFLLGLLIFVAFIGTLSAILPGSLVTIAPTNQPDAIDSQ